MVIFSILIGPINNFFNKQWFLRFVCIGLVIFLHFFLIFFLDCLFYFLQCLLASISFLPSWFLPKVILNSFFSQMNNEQIIHFRLLTFQKQAQGFKTLILKRKTLPIASTIQELYQSYNQLFPQFAIYQICFRSLCFGNQQGQELRVLWKVNIKFLCYLCITINDLQQFLVNYSKILPSPHSHNNLQFYLRRVNCALFNSQFVFLRDY